MGLFGFATKKDVQKIKAEYDQVFESYLNDVRYRDVGWQSLANVKGANTDVDETNRDKMHQKAREAFFYSPAGKRMVRYVTSYIMGIDFSIDSDIEAVQFGVDLFTKNPQNRWKRQLKEWSNRLQTDGEVFATFHMQSFNLPIIRETNPYEIKDVLTDPDDITRPILFKRVYESIGYKNGIQMQQPKTEYIPDINATEEDISRMNLSNNQVLNLGKRIHHIKTVTYSDRKRGLSDFSAILYYLSRMRTKIDNGLKISKLQEAYYLDVTVDGSASEVQAEAAKSQYQKPPKTASTFFHNKKVEMEIKQPKMDSKKEDKSMEHIMSQIVMGSGMPEWMLVGQANMYKAGAQEQSAPYVKLIEDYQELWASDLLQMLTFVIKILLDMNTDRNLLAGTKGIKGLLSQIDPDGMVVEQKLNDKGEMEDDKWENGEVKKQPFYEAIQIRFPEIVSRDEKKEADAVSQDIGNKLVSKKTASTKRGYNYDEEKTQMDIEREDELANDPLAQTLLDPDHDMDEEDEEEKDVKKER